MRRITRSSDEYRSTKSIKTTLIYQSVASFKEQSVLSTKTQQTNDKEKCFQ
ncbi:hypothetical protein SynBIOSE41_02834 [Synechococcus sp. BIOS-E4-1]|nr:hypothetical protein SynBIOSE41_02834 [Synechococcus sp. BIOS-E4-1]